MAQPIGYLSGISCEVKSDCFDPHRRGQVVKLLNSVPALLVVGLVAAPGQIFAQERSDYDHHGAVLEIGAAREWGLQDGKPALVSALRSR